MGDDGGTMSWEYRGGGRRGGSSVGGDANGVRRLRGARSKNGPTRKAQLLNPEAGKRGNQSRRGMEKNGRERNGTEDLHLCPYRGTESEGKIKETYTVLSRHTKGGGGRREYALILRVG